MQESVSAKSSLEQKCFTDC